MTEPNQNQTNLTGSSNNLSGQTTTTGVTTPPVTNPEPTAPLPPPLPPIPAAQYQEAAAYASLLLTQRRALNNDLLKIKDQKTYESYLQALLDSQDFVQVMVQYHQELFNDLADPNPSNAKNEPAYLGAYVATTPQVSYEEILTGNYCVGWNQDKNIIEKKDCPPAELRNVSSGVLSIPSLLKHDFGAQNIRRAVRTINRFICITYTGDSKDTSDPGRTVDKISPRYGGAMFNQQAAADDKGIPCSSCHSTLTDRSIPFRFTNADGFYNPTITLNTIEMGFLYDQNGLKIPNGQTHEPPGSYNKIVVDRVEDLGKEIAKDPRFDKCTTRRIYNWIFANDPLGPIATRNLEFFIETFNKSGRNMKQLIFSILTHRDVYITRTSSLTQTQTQEGK